MKKKHINKTFALLAIACIVIVNMLVTGCTNSIPVNTATVDSNRNASAAVTINTGKIGVLAKTKMIEMKKLITQISIKGTDTIVVTDTSILSGHGESIIRKTYHSMSAPKNFTLNAQSLDAAGKVIHSGSVDFSTIPDDTVNISLDLVALYSMLRVSFNDVPDSVQMVTLGIAATDTLDSLFTKSSFDTVILAYDYLAADGLGISHNVSLRASGSYYGKDTVLYAADTAITAIAGIDNSYRIVMKWIGPGIPDGAAMLTVTIGAVGTTLINSGFETMGALSDLVDDLEDGDEFTRYNTFWYTYSDISQGGFTIVTPPSYEKYSTLLKPVSGGALNSAYAANFTYTMNSGAYPHDPYAGMGLWLDSVSLNISSSTGIRFYYKGYSRPTF